LELPEMRVLVAVALIALGIASVTAASAADLPSVRSDGYSTRASAFGHRASPLVVYDYQPGVIVRAYWLAPWRHRHYFPVTGVKPEIGRDEDLSANTGGAPEPAETFQRYWSTSSAFMPEAPRASAQPLEPEPAPRVEQLPQAPNAMKP
jgi:hypothetical protein